MNKVDDQGDTLRDTLLSGWRQRNFDEKYKPEELNYPELSELNVHVWKVFTDLSLRRSWGESGPQRIAWRDIQAWQDVAQSRLEPWELRAVLALDDAFIEVWQEK